MDTSNESNVVGINDVQFRASLDPQLGDYHHSGGICLTGVWMEEMEEEGREGICVGITTLSLTLKQTQPTPIWQIVSNLIGILSKNSDSLLWYCQ